MSSFYCPKIPVKGEQFTLIFPIQAGGDGTVDTGDPSAAKISKDGGAQADLTNASTHLANGVRSLVLTASEMNADRIFLNFQYSGTDKDTSIIIYTREDSELSLDTTVTDDFSVPKSNPTIGEILSLISYAFKRGGRRFRL